MKGRDLYEASSKVTIQSIKLTEWWLIKLLVFPIPKWKPMWINWHQKHFDSHTSIKRRYNPVPFFCLVFFSVWNPHRSLHSTELSLSLLLNPFFKQTCMLKLRFFFIPLWVIWFNPVSSLSSVFPQHLCWLPMC